MLKFIIISLALIFLLPDSLISSNNRLGYGVSGIYNFQTTGIGIGARAEYILTGRIILSPQIAYFLPFNKINELYAGMAINVALMGYGKWYLYALGGGYYDRWINYASFNNDKAKPNNFAMEAGAGIAKGTGCLRPFIEQRYDFKWKEENFRVGIMLYFAECRGKTTQGYLCPAYK